jgi:uncharacterized protein YecT (DUF1311 family)
MSLPFMKEGQFSCRQGVSLICRLIPPGLVGDLDAVKVSKVIQAEEDPMQRGMPVAAAVGAVLAMAAADAQPASFDCYQAAHSIEWLICSDSVLMSLDGALGEAYAAHRGSLRTDEARRTFLGEQRAWLQRRLTECEIPASGDRLSLPQRWQAAPCLAELYRERLAALGQPQEAPFQPEEVTQAADFIHPLCLELALGAPTNQDDAVETTPVSVPLQACNDGNRHIPVEANAAGVRAAEAASVGVRARFAYRSLGHLPDGRELAEVHYHTQGTTGQFSEIIEIRRTPAADAGDRRLTARALIGGGDRCQLGIARADLVAEDTVAVEFNATPADFLAAGDPARHNAHYYRQLPDCPLCCFATVRRHFSTTGDADAVVSATIAEFETAGATEEDDPVLHCFEERVQAMAGSFPHTFSADDLRMLVREVEETCRLDEGQ